jgi:hypothetical protein
MKKVIDKRRIKRNSQKDKERKRERVTQWVRLPSCVNLPNAYIMKTFFVSPLSFLFIILDFKNKCKFKWVNENENSIWKILRLLLILRVTSYNYSLFLWQVKMAFTFEISDWPLSFICSRHLAKTQIRSSHCDTLWYNF